jgi:beta-xylosidase
MTRLIILSLFVLLTLKTSAQRLVMRGDHADPSVVKIGDTYWASATTSNWMPAFPLLRSADLENWTTVGHVFPQLPAWADYYFWAPEISYDNGKVYMYYSAHKKGGNLCLGIASADRPEGPYKDHGPIVCEEAGSIDGFPMRDENGKLYMIWKEDGNSVGKPTPIWIQELNETRTAVLGEKKELFRNEASWEGNLVEGVSMMRHGNYIYAFYAAAGCCGKGCNYQSGIARAKKLEGPWQKYPGNPVLTDEGSWKCRGHGTPVEKDGRFYFLYHAYDSAGNVYTGRQGILEEFVFTADNWIEFKKNTSSNSRRVAPVRDEFKSNVLNKEWQWSTTEPVSYRLQSGLLSMEVKAASRPAFLGRKTLSTHYRAATRIRAQKAAAMPGIALVGDEQNKVSAYLNAGRVDVIHTKNGRDSLVLTVPVSFDKKPWLVMDVENGKDIRFLYGKKLRKLRQLHSFPIDGTFLPPWDRALRAGLIVKGSPGETAIFECFEMKSIEE